MVKAFNREEWLNKAVKELRPLFRKHGYKLGTVHISVGWPGGRGNHSETIGQTWPTACSSDKNNHIFISPVVNDTIKVLIIIVHELAHVVDDCKAQHGASFIKIAKQVGLVKPWPSSSASDSLTEELRNVAAKIGEYKSPKLTTSDSERPKPGSRMLKIVCPKCGWTGRASRQWIDYSLPICGKCKVKMKEAE